jgi:hypothetical protein
MICNSVGSLHLQLTMFLPRTLLTHVAILCSIGLNSNGSILNVHQIRIFNLCKHFGLNMDMHFCRLLPPITYSVGLSLVASWFLQVMKPKINNSTTCVHSIVDCSNFKSSCGCGKHIVATFPKRSSKWFEPFKLG